MKSRHPVATVPLGNVAIWSANAPVPSFLGRGWSFPPSFERDIGTVRMSAGDADIKESLWILLSTSLGERIMLAGYGCDLRAQVFSALTTTTANQIAAMVANAIVMWEPRVIVESVSVVNDDALAGWVRISIAYMVRQTNTRGNLVYPFYAAEATLPPEPQ